MPDPSVARRVEYGRDLYASGRADGAREEREAVVRWLREMRSDEETGGLADAIEAGEHRKP